MSILGKKLNIPFVGGVTVGLIALVGIVLALFRGKFTGALGILGTIGGYCAKVINIPLSFIGKSV